MVRPTGMRIGLLLLVVWPALASAEPRALGATREHAHVRLRMLAGHPLSEHAENGYVRLQQITEDRLVAQLFHGPGFEHVLGARGERAAVRVCGRPALRLHERTTASTATPSYMRDGQVVHGPPVTLPARETIQVRFEHRGEAFALVWSGPPAVLARYRALERAFFRSVRCV